MKDDPRLHPRYEIDASADLSGTGNHRVQNISLGGICIQTSALEEVGASVEVVLNLGERASLDLHGHVVWVNRQPPEDVGIRWSTLGGEERALLLAFIEKLQSADDAKA
jgi:hypothetical protein